jgi:hypothetical protein
MTTAGKTFRIIDGVRRSKVFELCGISIIRAEIMNPDGTSGGVINVSVSDLRSPKSEIDVSTPRLANRFWRIHKVVQSGGALRLRPIVVTSGSQGTLIKDIQLRR